MSGVFLRGGREREELVRSRSRSKKRGKRRSKKTKKRSKEFVLLFDASLSLSRPLFLALSHRMRCLAAPLSWSLERRDHKRRERRRTPLGLGERKKQGIEILFGGHRQKTRHSNLLFDPPGLESPLLDHSTIPACRGDSCLCRNMKKSAKEELLWQHETPERVG